MTVTLSTFASASKTTIATPHPVSPGNDDNVRRASTSTHDVICSICIESYQSTAPVVVSILECGHVFHFDCVVKWFIENPRCPLCQKYFGEDLKHYRRTNCSYRRHVRHF
eukprot:GEMP01080324.1.p1 GENE.GEMP01080324.1~~GEMP01080324.1.p1  ORF type:complete len:110 (+),score=19.88 GEMP01080324.1:245-574(+)